MQSKSGQANAASWAVVLLQGALVVGMLVLAGVVATNGLSTGEAWTVVGLVGLATAAAVARTTFARQLLLRVGKLNIGPFGLELLKQVDQAARESPHEDADATSGQASTDVVGLQLKLEKKMTFIAKNMLDVQGKATYVTIGSLEEDGYLSNEQARTASQLMTLREEDLEALSPLERKEFLQSADVLVSGIRATVLRGVVCKNLKAWGWTVTELQPEDGQARADFLATRGAKRFRISPVFATSPDSGLLRRATARLTDRLAETAAVDSTKGLILVPKDFSGQPDEDSPVVKVDQLEGAVL